MKLCRPKPLKCTVVCLDAGMRNTGYGVYDYVTQQFLASGVFITKKLNTEYVHQTEMLEQQALYKALFSLYTKYKPDFILAELPHAGAQSSKAARMMAMASTIVNCSVLSSTAKYYPFIPSDTKQLVRSSGKASNQQVVEDYFGNVLPNLKSRREHVADAMLCLILLDQSAWFRNRLKKRGLTPVSFLRKSW